MKKKGIKFEYDADVDAAYLTLRAGKIVESEEVQPGIIVDFGSDHQLIGVEMIGFSRRFKSKASKRKSRVSAA